MDGAHQSPATVRVIPLAALGNAAPVLEADVQRASAIAHKNLVEIAMAGREGNLFFLATEATDGQTLRQFIDAKRGDGHGISLKGAVNLISHLANGLERAQSVLAHGALTPLSILVNKAGRVKVADLGLARALPFLARRGAPQGTAETVYCAPEILGGGQATAASDVYSLGIILYEVLTGRPPTASSKPASQVVPDVPHAVDVIIARALNHDPRGRFGSVAELKQALAAVLGGADAAQGAAVPGAPTPTPLSAAAAAAYAAGPHMQAPQQPVSQTGTDGARLALGRPFDPAQAAASTGFDDAQERWLVQKDRLDFGPFSLAQIRAQIDRGEFGSEHMIVDMDTGARRKIKDFPALREFTKGAERRLEQMRRSRAEQQHEATEKKKSAVTTFIVAIALVAVAGTIGLYVVSRKASEGSRLLSRAEEKEVDAFLKGVKLSFNTAKVAKRGARGRGGFGGANDGEFANDATFGDVTRGGGDETLDDDTIEKVMMGHYRSLIPCVMQERHRDPGLSDVSLDFVVRGTGKVSAVRVNGQKGGAFASCIMSRMQSFGFPKFNGAKTIASWSMSLR